MTGTLHVGSGFWSNSQMTEDGIAYNDLIQVNTAIYTRSFKEAYGHTFAPDMVWWRVNEESLEDKDTAFMEELDGPAPCVQTTSLLNNGHESVPDTFEIHVADNTHGVRLSMRVHRDHIDEQDVGIVTDLQNNHCNQGNDPIMQ